MAFSRFLTISAASLFLLLGGIPLSAGEQSARIVLTSPENLEDAQLAVQGVPASLQKQIADWKPDDKRWRKSFSLFVGQEPQAGQPAVLGSYKTTKNGFTFKPRFGLEPGVTYRAKLSLPGEDEQSQVFAIPAVVPEEPTKIINVYPTGKKLPVNLLRFYLHFSAPMTQGDSYRHLHLYDQTGEEVENPFLELPQELWSGDGRRLTLLLDPGRVKQGLKPREQSGPVLVPGRRYTLQIDSDWQDMYGQPLKKSFKRTFTTIKPDVTQPDPKTWKIEPPKAETRDPFTVQFDEPLDHAMLERVLGVENAKQQEIPGEIRVDRGETRWRFVPEEPWKAGTYRFTIRTNLEDRVGNSIARPFEVDLNKPRPPKVPKVLDRKFEVPARRNQ